MSSNENLSNLYTRLEASHYIDISSTKRNHHITIHESNIPASALYEAECFVDRVLSSQNMAFDEENLRDHQIKIENKKLAAHYHTINSCFQAYSRKYIYSPKVAVFFEACKKLNIDPEWMSFDRPLDPCLHDEKTTYAKLFNEFIMAIRQLCGTGRFQRRLERHKRNVLRRTARAMTWENRLFDWKSRHLILSLTLSYKEAVRSAITLNDVQTHLKRLLNNRRNNHLLSGIEGYLWKIEDGEKTGLHIHILIAYSTTSSRDIYIADKIGEYWEAVITDGMGQYWNCNRSKIQHELLGRGTGIGQINHYDTEKREALRNYLIYLAKADQYLRAKENIRTRVFSMSQVPERSTSGRPRARAMATSLASQSRA